MNKHKHHIIPRYRCEELGIDPDFDENIVEVTRKDHALIHWGYKCDDLKPLFEYVIPPQWIIDLIPRGDNRDVSAAVLTAKGEIDEIKPLSGKKHPQYKQGTAIGIDDDPAVRKEYMKYWRDENPEYRKEWYNNYNKEYFATMSVPKRAEHNKKRRKHHAKVKAETGYTMGKSYANSEYHKEYNVRYNARKKAEKAAALAPLIEEAGRRFAMECKKIR